MRASILVLFFAVSVPAFGGLAAADDDLPNFNAPADNTPLDVNKVNKYFGVPMFKGPSLWDDDAADVAHRLGWPSESRTSSQSSYRLYPLAIDPLKILGARVYSCVLYATNGHPTEVSIAFVNEGDYEWTQNFLKAATQIKPPTDPVNSDTNTNSAPTTNNAPNPNGGPTDQQLSVLRNMDEDDLSRVSQNVHEGFENQLKQDAQTITDALTKLFGEPQHMSFGGGSETRERVLRWDWQGHSFLLATPKDVYVSLRIVPVAFADNYGKGDVVDRDQLKANILKNVKTDEASGDVVVTDIPMVEQGPKGYCVPATWERYMRYLGIPADMYVLAMAAGSTAQGTNLDAMVSNVDSLVTLYHRRIDTLNGELDMPTISKNIDQGLPVMWCCYIHAPFEKAILRRKYERTGITDWSAWGADLKKRDETEIPNEINGSTVVGGHQRMIIGYNAKTNEIAISDSWSARYAIRWLTLPEANAINAGISYVIEP